CRSLPSSIFVGRFLPTPTPMGTHGTKLPSRGICGIDSDLRIPVERFVIRDSAFDSGAERCGYFYRLAIDDDRRFRIFCLARSPGVRESVAHPGSRLRITRDLDLVLRGKPHCLARE